MFCFPFNNINLDLVKYIKKEHGDYFCISVAGYPEGISAEFSWANCPSFFNRIFNAYQILLYIQLLERFDTVIENVYWLAAAYQLKKTWGLRTDHKKFIYSQPLPTPFLLNPTNNFRHTMDTTSNDVGLNLMYICHIVINFFVGHPSNIEAVEGGLSALSSSELLRCSVDTEEDGKGINLSFRFKYS